MGVRSLPDLLSVPTDHREQPPIPKMGDKGLDVLCGHAGKMLGWPGEGTPYTCGLFFLP
jgi:hypothetical protein